MSPHTWQIVPLKSARETIHRLPPELRDEIIDCVIAGLNHPDPGRTIAVDVNGAACLLTVLSNGCVAVYRVDESVRARRRFRHDRILALYDLAPLSAWVVGRG